MTRLRFVLLVLVVFLLAAALIGWSLPGTYEVQRSITMSASPERVYGHVVDLRKHEAWAPWRKADVDYIFTYGAQTVGVGATMSWKDERSSGELRIARAEPYRLIQNKLFAGNLGVTTGTWTFEPAKGGVQVTWRFQGDIAGPAGGWMAVFMDLMLGPFFDDGLADLKRVAEAPDLPAEVSVVAP